MALLEEFIHAIEVLAATSTGKVILIIILVIVAGVIWLLIRMNAANSKQSEVLSRHLTQQQEFFRELNNSQSDLLKQLTVSVAAQVAAMDKVSDAVDASNYILKSSQDVIEGLAAQNTTMSQQMDRQHVALTGVIQGVAQETGQTLAQVEAVQEGVNGIAAVVEAEQQSVHGISDAVDYIRTAVDTITRTVETLAKQAVTQETAERLTSEVHGLRDLVQGLDARLIEYQEKSALALVASNKSAEAITYEAVPDTA